MVANGAVEQGAAFVREFVAELLDEAALLAKQGQPPFRACETMIEAWHAAEVIWADEQGRGHA